MAALLYTPTDAAKSLGVSRTTLYRWMKIEGFPVLHIGGCTRIPVQALNDWVTSQLEVSGNA